MNLYIKSIVAVFFALLVCFSMINIALATSSIQLGSNYAVIDWQQAASAAITETIANYSAIAGITSDNWYGSQTTKANISEAATGLGGPVSNCFYIGHGFEDSWGAPGTWGTGPHEVILDDSGNEVWDCFDIYPNSGQMWMSSVPCLNFAFLWSCDSGNNKFGLDDAGYVEGMASAWLHIASPDTANGLSDNGYANPDTNGREFIGFQGVAPMFSIESDCYEFLSRFYFYALAWGFGGGPGYSVNQALDQATRDVWPDLSLFSQTALYNGQTYWTWEREWNSALNEYVYENVSNNGRMVCYGDGNMNLCWASYMGVVCSSAGLPVYGMKTETSGQFYVPSESYVAAVKVEMLFDDSRLVGDQTGGGSPYSQIPNYPDGVVDGKDIAFVASKFGTYEGSPGWDYMADVNGDGVVDGKDIVLAALNFGKPNNNYTEVIPVFGTTRPSLEGLAFNFNVGGVRYPDANGFVLIPNGATKFNVTQNGSQIGAMVVFWW
jgi:hypothetical protein